MGELMLLVRSIEVVWDSLQNGGPRIPKGKFLPDHVESLSSVSMMMPQGTHSFHFLLPVTIESQCSSNSEGEETGATS